MSDPGDKQIEDLRRRIDAIDGKLVALLNKRVNRVLQISRLKRAGNLPIYQPRREREILRRAELANRGPLPNPAIRRLFKLILEEGRLLERRRRRGTSPALKSRKRS